MKQDYLDKQFKLTQVSLYEKQISLNVCFLQIIDIFLFQYILNIVFVK